MSVKEQEAIEEAFRHWQKKEDFVERFVNEYDFAKSPIDAYNHFVSESIPVIIADTPEIVQHRKSTGELHVFTLTNPQMGRPTFINPETAMPEFLMPQQARLRNMSYAASLTIDIAYTRHRATKAPKGGVSNPSTSGNEFDTIHPAIASKFDKESWTVQRRLSGFIDSYGPLIDGEMYRGQILAHLPVMLGSVLCNSHGCGNGEEMATRDLAGLFIIGGSDRIISPISRLCWNHDFVFKRPKKKFAAEAEVRSCHDTRIHRSTATLKLQYTFPNGKVPMNGRQVLCDIPFLARKIHLAVVFLALGWPLTSIPFVVRSQAGRHWYPEFDGMLKALILSCKIKTEEEALLIVAQSSKKSKNGSEISGWSTNYDNPCASVYSVKEQVLYAQATLRRELLPHIGLTQESNYQKGMYLGVIVWLLFMCATNRIPPDDRDHYGFKRFDSAAVLMANLLRQVLGIYIRQRKQVIAKIFDQEDRTTGKEKELISIPAVFNDSQITMRFASCFGTGKWTASKGGCVRNGVARCPSHVNKVATVCELSRLSSPLKLDGKHVNARLIHPSQYGRVDPSETPEGRACGLVMYTCLGTRLSIGCSPRPLIALIEAYGDVFGLIPLSEWRPRIEKASCLSCFDHLTRLRVEGIPLGWVERPEVFVKWIRDLRRHDCGDDEMSVYYDPFLQHILVRQDAGRILKPLFVLDRLREGLLDHEDEPTAEDLKEEGVLEYIDGLEAKSFAVAFDPVDKMKREGNTNMTHMEIDGSFQFGLATSLIPAAHHNQCPRNTYQTAMGKQAVAYDPWNMGLHRSKHELHYPQRPFVSTKTGRSDNYAFQTSGSNAKVVILCDDLNQEDSLTVREGFVQRGAFTSSSSKLYKEHQRKSGSSTNCEVFQKPDPLTCGGRKDGNYDKVSEVTGIVPHNTRILSHDVVIAKVSPVRAGPSNSASNLQLRDKTKKPGQTAPMKTRDASVLAGRESGYVAESISTINAHGLAIRKVEVCSQREPAIGDKFSSRHGQKGTIGRGVPDNEMIYTRDGSMPDIVINPNCIASRMTIAQLIESLVGKACAVSGLEDDLSDATAFKPIDLERAREILRSNGFSPSGNEVYYHPITGQPLRAEIFTGFVFYQRLRHMVDDKMHARGPSGPVETVTRSPLEGRAKEGGQRVGEMEVEAFKAHGVPHALNERMTVFADPTQLAICGECGTIQYVCGKTGLPMCKHCGKGEHVRVVESVFGFMLLSKELAAQGLRMKFLLEDIVPT